MDRTSKIQILDNLVLCHKTKPESLKRFYIECNTLDFDLSANLYRVLNYDKLILSLKNQCLYMSKPSTWPDPYETFLLNNKARIEDGSIVSLAKIKNRIYSQCWSTNEESEALWNVHSPTNFKSVKIKSNGEKLMNCLYDMSNKDHILSYFIGPVNYVSEKYIIETLQEGIGKFFKFSAGIMPLIYSLFIKRKAFQYEEEVRLVFNAPPSKSTIGLSKIKNPWDTRKNRFSFKIDINDVIEEIIFHPNLKKINCKKMEVEIRKLGYNGKINQSKLFIKKDMILNF